MMGHLHLIWTFLSTLTEEIQNETFALIGYVSSCYFGP